MILDKLKLYFCDLFMFFYDFIICNFIIIAKTIGKILKHIVHDQTMCYKL